MISVGLVGAGDAAGYYLDREQGCEHEHDPSDAPEHDRADGEAGGVERPPADRPATAVGAGPDYYLTKVANRAQPETERVLVPAARWLGDGAQALGLTGSPNDDGGQALRALLAGYAPGGQRLVPAVLRMDPRGRLPAAPLVRALEATLPRARWGELGDARQRRDLTGVLSRVENGRAATLSVQDVTRIAARAGLDPVALYRAVDGTDVFARAAAHVQRRIDVRRAGLDVTVSAPKSVSVLHALGRPEITAAVRAAHDVALGEVLTYLQRHAAFGVRGHHGHGQSGARISSDGLIVAAFAHSTSRAGDPQLHTHLVIPNLIHGADGRWSALDTRAVYRHARTASCLYQAVLRGELTRALGVTWTPVQRGFAELAGMPRRVLRTFSKRRTQIIDALAERGLFGPKAAQAATLATRPAKQKGETAADARKRWWDEARAAGLSAADLDRLVELRAGSRTIGGEPPHLDALAADLFGPDGLTADQTTFTRQDLARAICEHIPAGTPLTLTDLDGLVAQLITHPDVLPVLDATAQAHDGEHAATGVGERRYTTAELVRTEQHALALANAVPMEPVATGAPQRVSTALASSALSVEQMRAVHTLLLSGRRLDLIAGPAGAGKTAALALAHQQWTASGTAVHGATISRLAAQHLQAATGIPTTSITALGVVPRDVVQAARRDAGGLWPREPCGRWVL